MLGHIQGPWGTEVPMHRRLAVRLRVAAALLLDYCFAGLRDAAVSATLLLPLLLWLGLLRIPLVRWSLGFVPECLRVGFRFGWLLFVWLGLLRIPLVRWSLGFVPECLRVGFRWVAALSWWGDIRRSVVLQRKRGGVARYLSTWWMPEQKTYMHMFHTRSYMFCAGTLNAIGL